MFSRSMASLITKPARYEIAPSCTTPLSRGAVQFELSTLPISCNARACFMASQPAILARKASVISTLSIGGEDSGQR